MSLRGTQVGLFTMDPGRTTGYTISAPRLTGTVEEIYKRTEIVVKEMDCQDAFVDETLCEVPGTIELLAEYQAAEEDWRELGISPELWFLVIEDFVLHPKAHSSARHGLSPVRVTSGLLTGLKLEGCYPNIVFQSPSLAKSTVTNDRLRAWGLWTPRLEHGRDATRHAATWVRRATQ